MNTVTLLFGTELFKGTQSNREFHMNLKIWFQEVRPQFLILDPCVVSVGVALAVYNGAPFNLLYTILALIGVVLGHISVNVLNDYFDYKSGIDLRVHRTPFSGGTGILPAQKLNPKSVYKFGVATLILALIIGVYFLFIYPFALIPLVIIAAVSVYLYTTHFAKWTIGEFAAGLNLGALVVLGAYITQTGVYTIPAIAACIAPGILVCNLLFLNEFPDVEADISGKRRTIPIVVGLKKAAKIYTVLTILVYVSIIIPVTLGILPIPTLIALATIPLAAKAISLALKYPDNVEKLMPALQSNVLTVLLTPTLMTVGLIVAMLIH